MYILPREYKCPECGFELEHTPSGQYSFLPTDTNGNPFCYKCLIEFISNNTPTMELKSEVNT